MRKLLAWIASLFKKTPTPADVVHAESDLDMFTQWLGENYSKAVVDGTLSDAVITSKSVGYRYAIDRTKWKPITVKVPVEGIICLGYDGKIGKFDWVREGGQFSKGLENVHHGYQGHQMPAKGTTCYLLIVSVDGKLRTNLCEAKWT